MAKRSRKKARRKATRKRSTRKRTTRRKPAARKPAARRKRTTRRTTHTARTQIPVTEFDGRAVAIEYVQGGKTYRHEIRSRSCRIYHNGDTLILSPLKVRGGQIEG